MNDVLARLGITALAERQLPELSGGQREVVSIAQSLVTRPRVVLMDEPTFASNTRYRRLCNPMLLKAEL
ncbi:MULTISPECIES: ATP-binding cassette domain-containing protein [unclassified Sulfitobacter]|uniref:ATP-binding cassette domain-containing protein n=1 Tax=unclassified Sulfitobacter TaxID=196795 RepID=UPI000B1B9293|nr:MULTISPECIES: ATP-binding cassette domain-containing protein [unclassified Sulfitobacter]